MKLFTLGPVQMYPYTLEKSAEQIPYFRTPEFSEVVLENEKMIKEIAYAQEGSKTVFLTASGTGAMEATIMNCLGRDDSVLVIDGGSFGHRFAQLCERHEIPHQVLKLPFGEALTREHLKEYEDTPFTALLVNIHETSTGQLYPMELLSDFCVKKNMLFIVDAISSFLADPFYFSKYSVDVVIFSSQKALALAPGLSIVLLSERIYEQRVKKKKCVSMYFDFDSHIENGKRGQTPFTPAVGVLLQLNDRLKHIVNQGIEDCVHFAAELAGDFRRKIEGLSVELPSYPLSNACTPLVFPDNNAKKVYENLKYNYGLVLTPNGGELADKVLRVGHLGCHTLEENDVLVKALKEVL